MNPCKKEKKTKLYCTHINNFEIVRPTNSNNTYFLILENNVILLNILFKFEIFMEDGFDINTFLLLVDHICIKAIDKNFELINYKGSYLYANSLTNSKICDLKLSNDGDIKFITNSLLNKLKPN